MRQGSEMTTPHRIPLPLLTSPFFGGGVAGCLYSEDPVVWVLTDDRAGNVSQAIGVAESLGWAFDVKPVEYTSWAVLPNMLRGASLRGSQIRARGSLRSRLRTVRRILLLQPDGGRRLSHDGLKGMQPPVPAFYAILCGRGIGGLVILMSSRCRPMIRYRDIS